MTLRDLRSVIERAAVDAALLAPRALRERLAIAPRQHEGDQLDADVRLVIALLAASRMPMWHELPMRAARAAFDRSSTLLAPAAAPLESVRDLSLEGPAGPLATRVYRPYGLGEASPALLYFHGGFFGLGSIASHDPVCRALAAAAGCQVLSVDYRLAPEHAYPAAVDDAVSAFRSVIHRANELSIDPSRVAVGGDSAGGYLAAQVAIATAHDERRPALQLLFYPVLDLTMRSPSIRALGEGLVLERSTMQWFHDRFAPVGVDRERAEVSPSHRSLESLRGLPPAHIQTAGFDPLRDDGFAYAKKLAEAGVAVEHAHYGALVHAYLNVAGVIDRAVAPYFDAAAALRRAFSAAR